MVDGAPLGRYSSPNTRLMFIGYTENVQRMHGKYWSGEGKSRTLYKQDSLSAGRAAGPREVAGAGGDVLSSIQGRLWTFRACPVRFYDPGRFF